MEHKSKAERIAPIIFGAVGSVVALLTFLWGSGVLKRNSIESKPQNTEVSQNFSSTAITTGFDKSEATLGSFPNDDSSFMNSEEIDDGSPKAFIDVCEPYHYSSCIAVTKGQTFSMAGTKYTNGIVQNDSSKGQFISNLGGQYSELSFVIGHVDDTPMCDYTAEIYLDGVLARTLDVKATGMPQPVTISVVGVTQIIVTWNASHNTYQDGCRIGFGNMHISSNLSFIHNEEANLDPNQLLFIKVCEPYHYSSCITVTNGQTFSMAGTKYTDGIVQNDSTKGQFISNLGGQYSELSFVIGHVDDTPMCDYTAEIYLDGVLERTLNVKATEMPQPVTISVADVTQIIVTWNASHNTYQDGCRIGFGNLTLSLNDSH